MASVTSPGQQHARLDLGAGDRQLVLDPVQRAPWTVNGGEAPLAGLDPGAHQRQRLGDPVDRPPADRLVAVERERAPSCAASQPGSSRISVPALPTSIGPTGIWALRRPTPRITTPPGQLCTIDPSSRTAASVEDVSGRVQVVADPTGSEAIAPTIAARWEIDLSAAHPQPAAQRSGRLEPRVHARATGKPSLVTSCSARRAASSPAIHSATTPSLMSGAG